MSLVVSTDEKNNEKASGNLMGGIKNPYLEVSDWGGQVDPVGLNLSK